MLRVGETVHCKKRGWLIVGRRLDSELELYRIKGKRRRVTLPYDYGFTVNPVHRPMPQINGRIECFTDDSGKTHAVKTKMRGGDPVFYFATDKAGKTYLKPAVFVKCNESESVVYCEYGVNVRNIKRVPSNRVVRFA